MPDKEFVFDLIRALENSSVTELEYETQDGRIYIGRRRAGKNAEPSAAERETPPYTVFEGNDVKSPIVGTFYASPGPDAEPYVEVGRRVRKGDVLCIVEAMKMMNEVESEFDGEVVEILAQSKEPVEFGQTLMIIK